MVGPAESFRIGGRRTYDRESAIRRERSAKRNDVGYHSPINMIGPCQPVNMIGVAQIRFYAADTTSPHRRGLMPKRQETKGFR